MGYYQCVIKMWVERVLLKEMSLNNFKMYFKTIQAQAMYNKIIIIVYLL